jgi:hypothetical protein
MERGGERERDGEREREREMERDGERERERKRWREGERERERERERKRFREREREMERERERERERKREMEREREREPGEGERSETQACGFQRCFSAAAKTKPKGPAKGLAWEPVKESVKKPVREPARGPARGPAWCLDGAKRQQFTLPPPTLLREREREMCGGCVAAAGDIPKPGRASAHPAGHARASLWNKERCWANGCGRQELEGDDDLQEKLRKRKEFDDNDEDMYGWLAAHTRIRVSVLRGYCAANRGCAGLHRLDAPAKGVARR